MRDDPGVDAFYDALLGDDPQQLYDHAPCGYVTTTPDGVIVTVNQTFLALTGYRRDELVGLRTFADLLTPGGRIYHETHFAPMLQMQQRVSVIALDVVTSDKRRVPILVNAVLERNDEGTPIVIRTAIFDATERRAYERELLLAKRRAEAAEVRATELARTLQQSLIPPTVPRIPGLDVAAMYRPAGSGDEVGGDFYDIFEVGTDHWVVVIGDVCGKGVDAAVVTMLARFTMRAAAMRHPSLGDALVDLNDTLLRAETDRFCTMVIVRVRRVGGTWTVTVACAGHPLPLLARGSADPLPVGRPGSLLGVLTEPVFHEVALTLEADDALVLYTDGVTEGRRGESFFGPDGLATAVSRHRGSASDLAHGILDEVMEYQSGRPRDDIAIVVVRLPEESGHEEPAHGEAE